MTRGGGAQGQKDDQRTQKDDCNVPTILGGEVDVILQQCPQGDLVGMLKF